MFKVLKINDLTLGHEICGPCIGIPAPLNYTVFAENMPIAVVGDTYNPHPNALCEHPTLVQTGSATVTINNILIGSEIGTVSCFDTIVLNPVNLALTNVFVGS